MGHVYLLSNGRICKIGMSSGDDETRIRTVQSEWRSRRGIELSVIYIYERADFIETEKFSMIALVSIAIAVA
jgi:hypothetical protein